MFRHLLSFTHVFHWLVGLPKGRKLPLISVIAGLVFLLTITVVALNNDPPWPAPYIQLALSLI